MNGIINLKKRNLNFIIIFILSISLVGSIILTEVFDNSNISSDNYRSSENSNPIYHDNYYNKNSALLSNSSPDVLCSPVCDGPW